MRYFLRQTKVKGDIYLQIYQSQYIKEKKGGRNKSVATVGMLSRLREKGIKDPIAYYQEEVRKMNESLVKERGKQIGEESASKNYGHFLVKSVIGKLDVESVIKKITEDMRLQYGMDELLTQLIEAQVVCPKSKWGAANDVMPSLFESKHMSYDQVLSGINYLGRNYEKYVEMFNVGIDKAFGRDTSKAFFDCTNYYFEIDLPGGDRQKGPSKEKRTDPIIGQALLMDIDCIPLGMKMFPGNESEKPYIRKAIQDLKDRYNITTRTVQVADKGLNCARNIYEAAKEGNDGYIFSKSVKGKNLPEKEKKWILLSDDDGNQWHVVLDADGNERFRYKETVDKFRYEFTDDCGKKVSFEQTEKRVVTYNSSLAKKQIAEIDREIDKAERLMTAKAILRDEYGDSAKFVNISGASNDGEEGQVVVTLNKDAIEEAKRYAGYNLLVTSETKMPATEIYEVYHHLTRIEECFRIMKTNLEARPVYLQDQYSIYGHFLICYLALTVIRLLEQKVFGGKLCASEIINAIRGMKVAYDGNGGYINCARDNRVIQTAKQKYQLTKLTNLYLTKKEVENIVNAELIYDKDSKLKEPKSTI